ncbi:MULTISPECIES: Hsp33 family molecular chaperone HslO [Methylocaldum]|jgi:molecular chaperone Hsp33|uniref:Hsp33 family molecular chaperone HslO n=1 Tax=unclassified Methylocaldum TaxID=2622260 RepID=UPI00098BC49A|nr:MULTISPECIES: Hsp33 family molecular chaperone HslO [unclassified Methylocaldum]MBP1148399.1 molecular chaperone Hsp33 [Methylocaldum sp. RMAD-M]MDV3240517.1 Hsp33 family molecular chaperone HslO [Methylocaldum sp.]MVF22884.1 Hsp33 family molecular chaperone HslO [Methylocaldum sp. BRCS4]
MSEFDSFQRFLFEDLGIRGELVRLDASWQAVLERHPYPPAVSSQLGQALAAVLLLSATIKFKGSLILQAQGHGPLNTLVAQATHQRTIRGLAHWRGEVTGETLSDIYGPGHLVLTVQNEDSEPYQGIVALEGDDLAGAIETYFSRSEQLATRLWLAADEQRAAGLLIQELPAKQRDRDDWTRVEYLADTVTEGELLNLPSQELLYRLFNEESVRLFDSEPISFRCGCSRERIESVLLTLGNHEVESILEQEDSVEVGCEFCNRRYHFDRVDIGGLFTNEIRLPSSSTRQ